MTDFWQDKRVLLTGASGFVGRNLVPILKAQGCELMTPTHQEYDLLEQANVRRLLADTYPDLVFHLAGLVGGIWPNKLRPAEFFYQNLMMNTMMLHESYCAGVYKYVTCIGGCSYPAHALSPIPETELWNGYPQPESAPYSIAKKMNVVQSEAYRRQYGFNSLVLVPGNVYGPYDNFNLEDAHVIPALVRKVYEAKMRGDRQFVVWGSGRPIRDFVYVEDVARGIVHAAETYESSEIVNISSGHETSIRELVELVIDLTGFSGEVIWDCTKPDGQERKGFDVTRMRTVLGYECRTPLREGLAKTIEWFAANYSSARI